MDNPKKAGIAGRSRAAGTAQRSSALTPEHCLRLILHRKWLILAVFFVVSATTIVITARLPNVYSSDTLILVDPQKVPENYVKSTVSGDIRNRLGTLKQQILSATRLQKIIDSLNLYPAERKSMAREDLIAMMRSDIGVNVVGDFGGSQYLQAFRITYSGNDPQLVAQVANELAAQFIDENLKAREQQANGTTEFLTNQLEQTRKTLEAQEAKLRDFRLRHIGEMPEQQAADLQILGQLQSQLQLEGDALSRAEQQKTYTQSLMASAPAGVVDLDDAETMKPGGGDAPHASPGAAPPPPANSAASKEKLLAALLARGYTENHPDVRKLRLEIQSESKNAPKTAAAASATAEVAPARTAQLPPPPLAPSKKKPAPPPKYVNPILQTQLESVDSEIAKHKEKVQLLTKQIAGYQSKLESIPVREQEVADLVRDYEISKAHYSQLLNNQLSAETAAQLEVRQKGEQFSILDPAQPPQTPSKPNRTALNLGGCIGGLGLGLLMALATELMGFSITSADHLLLATGFPVLEVIPLIETRYDRLARRRRMYMAAASGAATVALVAAVLVYHYRSRFF